MSVARPSVRRSRTTPRVTPRSAVQPRVHCLSGVGHAIAGKLPRHATRVVRGDHVRKIVTRIDKQKQRIWTSTIICVVFAIQDALIVAKTPIKSRTSLPMNNGKEPRWAGRAGEGSQSDDRKFCSGQKDVANLGGRGRYVMRNEERTRCKGSLISSHRRRDIIMSREEIFCPLLISCRVAKKGSGVEMLLVCGLKVRYSS